jgi:hypothetical protein
VGNLFREIQEKARGVADLDNSVGSPGKEALRKDPLRKDPLRKDPLREHKRLLEQGASIRAEAIRMQMTAVRTFCEVAESQLQRDLWAEAQGSFQKIHKALATIAYHIQEPGHVSPKAGEELRHRLDKLRARVEEIGAKLRSQWVNAR